MEATFSTPRPNVIECSEGFAVELAYPTLHYSEGGRSVDIECEFLVGPVLMVVYSSSVRRWKSDRGPLVRGPDITPEDRARIGDNVRRAFKSQGNEIELG